MIVGVDVSTWIVGVDEDKCDGILIGSSLEGIQINLKISFREEIVFANLDAAVNSASIIVRISWIRKQNVACWIACERI